MNIKYTLEICKQVLEECNTNKEIKEILNIRSTNVKNFKLRCHQLGLDTSHIKGGKRGRPSSGKRNSRDSLLRKKLMSDVNFVHKCGWCNNTHWFEGLIPLELDHIDGDPINDSPDNLRFLCPNCHALTPTYRHKNRKIFSKV